MECLQRPVWYKYIKEELNQFKIEKPKEAIRKKVSENWDAVAKPIGGLGRFEELTAQIGGIIGTDQMDLSKKAVIIMCADNGVVEEGISQSGQEVTAAVAGAMARKQSSVCRMAEAIGADIIPVDIGINQKEHVPGILNRRIRRGTGNFRKEPAMTEQEAVQAIAVGIDMVRSCKEAGYKILATGEMGIGNTTTSSAVTAALLRTEVSAVTGRGAGLSKEGLLRKRQVIAEAIEKYRLYHADALTVLKTVGGLDIAGLTGLCIGGAVYHVPVVLDGVISMTAALLAERLLPGTKEFLLPSHKGKEPAAEALAKELDMEPVIDGKMALGEGTGAVMMLSLLEMALRVYRESAGFSDIRIEQYRKLI